MEVLPYAIAFSALLAWDFGRRWLGRDARQVSESIETDLRGEIATLGARLTETEAELKKTRTRTSHVATEMQALSGSRRRRAG